MTAKKSINLEKSLADLEALVEELESGDLPLDKAMKKFGEETLEEFDAND
jgi:exodeoxyribonuclease VII small subunit